MDSEKLKSILSNMSQSEIIDILNQETRNAKSLKAKCDKAEKSEMATLFQKRTTANAWATSEQFEKSKDAIRTIVKFLI